jgi:cell division protein FtsB
MNAAQSPRRPITAVVVQSLMWLWLISLSVFVALGYQAVNDQTDQNQLDTRLQRLEAPEMGLAESIDAIQQRPAVATAADLKDTRELLEARAAQVEKALSGYAAAEDLQALRTEVEQIKTRQTVARDAASAQPRVPTRPTAKPEPPPLPFRIVGAELRAGQRSLSVAPNNGNFTPDQLQVLLPGDAVGPWRLQAVEGNTAVFQAGDQTRRMAIP